MPTYQKYESVQYEKKHLKASWQRQQGELLYALNFVQSETLHPKVQNLWLKIPHLGVLGPKFTF